jgi:hypothetical protein
MSKNGTTAEKHFSRSILAWIMTVGPIDALPVLAYRFQFFDFACEKPYGRTFCVRKIRETINDLARL